MDFSRRNLTFLLAFIAPLASLGHAQSNPQPGVPALPNLQPESEQIVALANQARKQAGVAALQWDPALAAAALKHCQRMAAEGPIAHRYGGESDLTARAAEAGAHFSVIEENVAIASSPAAIHEEWMQSPGHRQNLLSPDVDHIGVAVVSARGVLYSVADYSRAVQQFNPAQAEARVAALIRPSGLSILPDPSLARSACAADEGLPRAAAGGMQPRFIMRWQDADLAHLPQELADHIATGRYHSAAVGSCQAQNLDGGSFTAYRIAVILY